MLSTHVPRPGLRRAVGLLVTTVLTAALLPFALAGPASTQAPAPIAAAACADPAWTASAVYTAGDLVTHAGHTWRAKWWTRNETPGTTGE